MAFTEWALCRASVGQSGIRMILCDDDGSFSQKLKGELDLIFTKLNMKASVDTYSSPKELPPGHLASCDIAFLDIDFESDEQNGIDIARLLRQKNDRALIFFVTNYIDYAPAGYEVQAFRYILKRDMEEVLERYILQAMEAMAEGQEYLQLLDRELSARLPLEAISYLEVMDHYVSVHAGEENHKLSATLSSLETELAPHGFLRIHKSYLVNMSYIRKFRSRECLLADGTVLAVSEKHYSQQKQKYLLWKGLK